MTPHPDIRPGGLEAQCGSAFRGRPAWPRLRLLLAALTTDVPSRAAPFADPAPITGPAVSPLGHAGRWLIDAAGRVVVLHGLNQVYKVPPYTPSADGFGDDDAAFLAANGFNGMRVGIIWAAVEPQPGMYDDNYLASVAQTVQILQSHGILSLLDSHQDLYNEIFQGEGAPAWAVQGRGAAQPATGLSRQLLRQPRRERRLERLLAQRPCAGRGRTGGPLRGACGRMSPPTSAATRGYSATRY